MTANNFEHDEHASATETAKPTAYRVDDDDNLKEKDLKRTFLFGDNEDKNPDQPGFEGQGMGGQSFGKDNVTPAGDDKANPSQVAGYANEYFRRTEPSEEHPEDTNFKEAQQQGQPDYVQSQPNAEGESQQEKQQGDDEPYQQPDPNKYQEGTADNDGQDPDNNENIPGPGELPDQQKVGENNVSEPGKADYKPEYDRKPDYGSNSPEDPADPI